MIENLIQKEVQIKCINKFKRIFLLIQIYVNYNFIYYLNYLIILKYVIYSLILFIKFIEYKDILII
jgi:hypothetical protein